MGEISFENCKHRYNSNQKNIRWPRVCMYYIQTFIKSHRLYLQSDFVTYPLQNQFRKKKCDMATKFDDMAYGKI